MVLNGRECINLFMKFRLSIFESIVKKFNCAACNLFTNNFKTIAKII